MSVRTDHALEVSRQHVAFERALRNKMHIGIAGQLAGGTPRVR
jgi:hypothetical protein